MLQTLFWGSCAWLGYTYLGYPALLGGAARFMARPWHRREDHVPTISLIVAALNEARVIEAKIQNALDLDYPRDSLEIIIASNGSSDETVARAQRFTPRVQVLDLPRPGKTAALNQAVAGARGEVLVFSDANVFLQRDALRKLVRHFADPSIAGVSGDVRLDPEGFDLGESQGFYYRYERFIQAQESALGSIIGVDGGLYALRRAHFRAVPPELINDDFIISMEAAKRGGRVIYDSEVLAFEASPVDAANELRRKTRVEHGNFQSLLSGWGRPNPRTPFLLWAYVSHKVLRWLGFCPLAGALISSLLLTPFHPIYGLAAGVQLAFYGLALIGAWQKAQGDRWTQVPHYFCLENLAAILGLWHQLTGRRAWGTAQTRDRDPSTGSTGGPASSTATSTASSTATSTATTA